MNDPRILLAPLSTTGQVEERLHGALSVARFFGAHLQLLHAQATPSQFIPREVAGLTQSVLHQLETIADSNAKAESAQLRERFTQLANEHEVELSPHCVSGTPTAHWLDVPGLRSELIARQGKLADLLIIPQSKDGSVTATLEAAILRSGRPILVMPRTQTHFHPQHVAIAWNGSAEAARAIYFALPILKRAHSVSILARTDTVASQPDENALRSYLACHGIESQVHSVPRPQHKDGEELLKAAIDREADLIVMGAYSHPRLHQQIFGGVTTYMLGHATMPLLMAH